MRGSSFTSHICSTCRLINFKNIKKENSFYDGDVKIYSLKFFWNGKKMWD